MRHLFSFAAILFAAVATANPQLIARLNPGTDPRGIATACNVRLKDRAPGNEFFLYELKNGQDVESIQATMQGLAGVVWSEDNAELGSTGPGGSKGSTQPVLGPKSLLMKPTNYRVKNAATLDQIGWSKTAANAPGRTVKIAILDTGLGVNQTDIWAAVSAQYNAVETGQPAYDQPLGTDTDPTGPVDQATGHGTMVAGIVNMVAPRAKLLIARVADSDGLGTSWTITKGLAFAVQQGAEVANISMGSPDRLPAINDVIDWATEENQVLVVASIGNNGQREALEPSGISKVLCVAGLDATNHKASFSNWENDADSCAPSVGLWAPWFDGEACQWEGTSLAAPLVAGCLADALRKSAHRLPSSLIDIVTSTGTDIDNLNRDYKQRLGTLLNHTKLVQRISQ